MDAPEEASCLEEYREVVAFVGDHEHGTHQVADVESNRNFAVGWMEPMLLAHVLVSTMDSREEFHSDEVSDQGEMIRGEMIQGEMIRGQVIQGEMIREKIDPRSVAVQLVLVGWQSDRGQVTDLH